MRIIQLTPGAGDSFYCENCLRDHASVRQLRSQGVDVSMVPLYLPAIDEQGRAGRDDGPIFFGGINVYLQQKTRLFRHTPRWVDRLFDARLLLRWAGRKAGMTRSRDLAETMISMLKGEHGRQVKELDRLVTFLADQPRPDVVHLSNALLTGLAGRIRRALGCKVTCGLEDEEAFLDALEEPYRKQCWDQVSAHCGQLDGMLSSSGTYGQTMMGRMRLPVGSFRHVPDGIDASLYCPAAAAPDPPAIGFLSQMTRGKGLAELIDAFVRLKQDPRQADLRLRICGGKTAGDEAYIAELQQRLARAGLEDQVDWLARFDLPAKREFFDTVTVLSVPTLRPEASALFALESLAAGVPLVLPDHGVNVEIAEATGGIERVAPNDPDALVEGLAALLQDGRRREKMARDARAGVVEHFDIEAHGRKMEQAFAEILAG